MESAALELHLAKAVTFTLLPSAETWDAFRNLSSRRRLVPEAICDVLADAQSDRGGLAADRWRRVSRARSRDCVRRGAQKRIARRRTAARGVMREQRQADSTDGGSGGRRAQYAGQNSLPLDRWSLPTPSRHREERVRRRNAAPRGRDPLTGGGRAPSRPRPPERPPQPELDRGPRGYGRARGLPRISHDHHDVTDRCFDPHHPRESHAVYRGCVSGRDGPF